MNKERKIALITGSAKGIGKATALELAAENYDVIINYLHSQNAAESLRKTIQDTYHVNCMALQGDVSKEEEVDNLFTTIEESLGVVDVLVNNAAIDLSNLFHLKTAEEFRRTLDVNVIGAYNCAKRAGKPMITSA